MQFDTFADVFDALAAGKIGDEEIMKLLGDLKESATEKSEEDRGSGTDDRQYKIVASEQLMVENEDIVRLPDSADENSEEVLVLSDRPCEVLASSEVQESCTFKLTEELDPTFPGAAADGSFQPSPFQEALLQHVAQVRERLQHSTGLVVMATALGKTIFAILDMSNRLAAEAKKSQSKDGSQVASPWRPEKKRDTTATCSEFPERETWSGTLGTKRRLPERCTGHDAKRAAVESKDFGNTAEDAADVPTRELAAMLDVPVVTALRAMSEAQGDPNAAAEWLLGLRQGRVWQAATTADSDGPLGAGAEAHWLGHVAHAHGDMAGFAPPDGAARRPGHWVCTERVGGGSGGLAKPSDRQGEGRDDVLFLFLVHTKAIRDAAFAKFRRHFTAQGHPQSAFVNVTESGQVGRTLSAGEGGSTTFLFCLLQSFEKLPSRLVARVTHVTFDECHHLLAPSYLRIFQTLLASPRLRYCLGMTATLRHRSDPQGEALRRLFKDTLYISLSWMDAKRLKFFPAVEYLEALPTLQRGADAQTYAQILAAFEQHRSVKTVVRIMETSVARMKATAGAPSPADIVAAVCAYQQARGDAGLPPKRRILVFVGATGDADECARLFSVAQQGSIRYTSMAAHYKQGARGAAENMRRFISIPRTGRAHVLVTVMMLNEGWDCPGVDLVVLGRTTESEIVFAQQVNSGEGLQMGRGLRKDASDPQKQLSILDLALNLRRRWKRLAEELPDAEVREMLSSFWMVSNFVGAAIE